MNKLTSLLIVFYPLILFGQTNYLFHVGNDPRFSGTLILSPQNNFGIVVLSNGMYPMNEVWNDIPFEITDLFKSNLNKQMQENKG